MERRHDLDWLRVGAFALLIFYHIGMVFVPWDYHVKTPRPFEWATWPMLALNPWRLALLFLISGYATRALLAKTPRLAAFIGQRSVRLLVPLVAGLLVFVAPQPWAELQAKHGYPHGFVHFYLNDYFTFGDIDGVDAPTWNHLWFVVYLWFYAVLLAAVVAIAPPSTRAAAGRLIDRLLGGWRLFVLPIAFWLTIRVTLYPVWGEPHDVFADPYGHALYGSAFLLGVWLARAPGAWTDIARLWRPAAAVALVGYAAYLWVAIRYPGELVPPAFDIAVARVARTVLAWGAILALLGWARTRLDRDGPARRYLVEAVFPFYIAHQTIIVVAAHLMNRAGVPPVPQFVLLVVATVVGCLATYEVARRSTPLRPLFGLKLSRN